MHCSHGLCYRAPWNGEAVTYALRAAERPVVRGVMLMGSAVHVHAHAMDVTVSGLVHAAVFQGQEALCSIGFRQPGGTLSDAGFSVSVRAIATSMSADTGDNTHGVMNFEGVTFDGSGVGLRVCDGDFIVMRFRGSCTAANARRVPEQVTVLATRCQPPASTLDSMFNGLQRDAIVRGCSIGVEGCTFRAGSGEDCPLCSEHRRHKPEGILRWGSRG